MKGKRAADQFSKFENGYKNKCQLTLLMELCVSKL